MAASTPSELQVVMADLQAYGSPNWTFESAANFVTPELWPELRSYFENPEMLMASAVTEAVPNSAFVSVSAFIAGFHRDLQRAADDRNTPTFSAPEVDFETDEFADRVTIPAVQVDSEETVGAEIPVEKPFRECPICLLEMRGLVTYRNTQMCAECAAMLRRG